MLWVLGIVVVLVVLGVGYVAHKYPSVFGKAVDAGAVVVNKIDDTVKEQINKK